MSDEAALLNCITHTYAQPGTPRYLWDWHAIRADWQEVTGLDEAAFRAAEYEVNHGR